MFSEKSNDSVVLFHALRILMAATITMWASLPVESVEATKLLVLSFGEYQSDSQPPYVLNQAATVYAALVKRSWMPYVSNGESLELMEMKRSVQSDVSRLASSEKLKTRIFGVSLIDCLVNEFECSRKASSMDLGAEHHMDCFMRFEQEELGEFFMFIVSMLLDLTSQPITSPEQRQLMTNTLQLCTRILTWPFGQIAQILGIHYANPQQLLRPPASWREILITPNMEVLAVYNNAYNYARTSDPQLAHFVREGLMQLASLSGEIFGSTEETRSEPKKAWITAIASLLNELLSTEHLTNSEMRDMSVIVHRFFGTTSIASIVESIGLPNAEVMMSTVSARTCETMDRLKTVAEGGGSSSLEGVDAYDHFDDSEVEDTVLGEALDTWLQAWASWSSDATTTVFPNLPCFMFEVFSAYVSSRLAIARAELMKSEAGDQWLTYDVPKTKQDLTNPIIIDQLSSATAIGRMSPRTSTEYLKTTLEEVIKPLKEFVERGETAQEAQMRLEELHWLLMIIGHFLCHVSHGEIASIPLPINRLCNTFDEQGEPNQIVALSSLVFYVVSLENTALEMSHAQQQQHHNGAVGGNLVWSPLVAETLAWFLAHWSSCYLLLSDLGTITSPSLFENYGQESPNALAILDSLLRKIIINFTSWGGETAVLIQTCQILHLISKLDTLHMSTLVRIPAWNELFSAWTSGNATMISFPPKVQRRLMMALAHIVQSDSVDDQVSYLNLLVGPIDESLQSILHAPDFHTNFQSPAVMLPLQMTLERIRGLARSTRGRTYKAVNQIVSRYLPSLVELIILYKDFHSIVLLILKICSDYVSFILCCTYDDGEMANFHNALANLLQGAEATSLFKRRSSRTSTTTLGSRYGSDDTQLEQYEELLQILLTLCGVVENEGAQIAGLCFYALSVITPYIDNDMLSYPMLCRHYFHFISAIFGVHASEIGHMDDAMFEVLIHSLEIGLQQSDEYIQMAALDAVTKIASFNFKMMTQKNTDALGQKRSVIQQFITTLLKWMLFEDSFKIELMTSASSTYFSLVCSEEEAYKQTVSLLIQDQPDPSQQQRLSELFAALLNGIEFSWSRKSKEAFLTNMTAFVPVVRSILHRR